MTPNIGIEVVRGNCADPDETAPQEQSDLALHSLSFCEPF